MKEKKESHQPWWLLSAGFLLATLLVAALLFCLMEVITWN